MGSLRIGRRWGLVCGAVGLLVSCASSFSQEKFIKVFFPDKTSITAELAVSDEERHRGLMFREKINDDQGMLFVFEEEELHSFWMFNTKIHLDILWLDKDRRIVHIAAGVPPCPAQPCPSYAPEISSLYVLELRSGKAAALGLRLYDRLDFVLPRGLRQTLSGPRSSPRESPSFR